MSAFERTLKYHLVSYRIATSFGGYVQPNWLPWQRALKDRQNHNHSSINRENLARIGPVDVKIIGLTEIVKK